MSENERSAGRPSYCPEDHEDGHDDDNEDDVDDDGGRPHLCHKHLVELLSHVEVGGGGVSHSDNLDWQLRNVH